jgi:hypothetical protein
MKRTLILVFVFVVLSTLAVAQIARTENLTGRWNVTATDGSYKYIDDNGQWWALQIRDTKGSLIGTLPKETDIKDAVDCSMRGTFSAPNVSLQFECPSFTDSDGDRRAARTIEIKGTLNPDGTIAGSAMTYFDGTYNKSSQIKMERAPAK